MQNDTGKITTIDGVIARLDTVIQWSLQHGSRIGYFAMLYKRMTIAVKEGIINNAFQDGQRMEQLDIIFATRYFDAWKCYINKQPCSSGWQLAFNACQDTTLIVLQHLILGINTHINLDLCIAAAQCCPGNDIFDLEKDFEKINDIIEDQSQLVQHSLSNIWYPLKLIDNIGNNEKKAVLNFSISNARKCSWANAIVLANLTDNSIVNEHITQIDRLVVQVGSQVINPGIWMEFLLKPVRMMENQKVDKNIGLLNC